MGAESLRAVQSQAHCFDVQFWLCLKARELKQDVHEDSKATGSPKIEYACFHLGVNKALVTITA